MALAVELWNPRHGATAVRELASSVGLRLVESVGGAISRRLATSRDGGEIPSILVTNAKLSIQRR